MLTVQNLTKSFGDKQVVNIPQLHIAAGESFGLAGNNGAGKTTFFRIILDLLLADSGQVLLDGQPTQGQEGWKSWTGSFLDEGFLIDFLSPDEYFAFVAQLHGLSAEEREARLAPYTDFFAGEIREHKKYIRELSKGNQKKVGIAAALMIRPRLVILDEPFANLDPSSQIRLKQILREEAARGTTLLISSHDLNHVVEVCHRMAILSHGQIIRDEATTATTLQDLEAYFSVG